MLLIFFLVTTSMETDKGLQRRLPPSNPDRQEQAYKDVDAKRVMTITITADNKILADDKPTTDKALESDMIAFVQRVGTDHIIELKASPEGNYETYFHVQNIVARAYAALRNDYAQRTYKHSYAECNDDERKAVREKIPQRLSENFTAFSANASGEETVEQAVSSAEKGGNECD